MVIVTVAIFELALEVSVALYLKLAIPLKSSLVALKLNVEPFTFAVPFTSEPATML